MKLGSRIEGLKVHQVGYRMLLTNKALDINLPGFSAQNRVEDGRQVVHVFFEGDESQVSEFKRFIESNKPPEAMVSSITFQDYQGKVGDTLLYSQKISSQHLSKGIDAILRMEKKQDTTIAILREVKEDTSCIKNLQAQMLDKQDQMLDKQDKTTGILKDIKEDTSGNFTTWGCGNELFM